MSKRTHCDSGDACLVLASSLSRSKKVLSGRVRAAWTYEERDRRPWLHLGATFVIRVSDPFQHTIRYHDRASTEDVAHIQDNTSDMAEQRHGQVYPVSFPTL
jgi:hypothetical protein